MMMKADTPMNIGTKAKARYEMPPMIGPLTAVSAFLADITRWNTSCCGIEPIMIVIGRAEPEEPRVQRRLGKELEHVLAGRVVR